MVLNATAKEAIQQWLRVSKMDHPLFGDYPIFCSQGKCKAITPRQAFAIIVDAVERAGVDSSKIGTHTMRKTFASALWVSPFVNRDMAKMARLLGHADFSNTLRYLQFLDGSLEHAVMSI